MELRKSLGSHLVKEERSVDKERSHPMEREGEIVQGKAG